MPASAIGNSLRVLVVAPTTRDAELICATLQEHGLEGVACADLAEVTRGVQEQAGALILAQEALANAGLAQLRALLSQQPPWSDLPLIVLTIGGEAAQQSASALAVFGPAANITLLERPCTPLTLVTAVRVALKARQRQYDLRTLLANLDERTRELTRSNADLEQFAYVTSHDLQEPLRMISSYLGLIERRLGPKLDTTTREYFNFAVDGATRMRAMIDAVLQYARISRDDDHLEDIAAGDAVAEALANLRTEIERSAAEIRVAPLPRVIASRQLLAKVFQNLISNALKFRSSAPPRVVIEATEQAEAWEFRVSDNGIGIEPGQQERLFKLFQRLHPNGEYGGTGIGLAMCRRVVERRGGRIWVDSLPGQGSTFRFTIPRQRALPTTDRRPLAVQPSIVLVDDNPGDIALLKEVFGQQAPEVTVDGALSGNQLIEQLSRRERASLPSVMLIDLNMPGMDGKAVLSFVKSHPIYRAIPAVIYTSSLRQAERQQCLELGADDYIVKPANLKDCEGVVSRIRELIAAS